MKFLHTFDWQIGMKALQCGSAAHKVREERLAAGKRVIDAAHTSGAEFILLAGDLFEDNAVDRSLVRNAAKILGSFRGTVYVIPGNHDPLVPGSVWDEDCWNSFPNVTILREASPVEIPGGMLYPSPCFSKHSLEDPTAWIATASDTNTIRVGVADGSVAGIGVDDMEYPIPLGAAETNSLDYLALGHWHSTNLFSGSKDAVRMAYSGTHETTAFGERDSGNALLVELPQRGAPPEIRPIPIGGLTWKSISVELLGPNELKVLQKQLDEIDVPGRTILNLKITGLLHPEMQAQLVKLSEQLSSQFLFSRLQSDLKPSPTDDSWVLNLPPGIIRGAAERLRRMASDPAIGQDPAVATRALLELYAISHEVSK